jgi:hypothetical protein
LTYFTSAQLSSWIQTWMSTVKNATGIDPIIYIGPSNASYVSSSLNTYGLWIDDYNSNPNSPPLRPISGSGQNGSLNNLPGPPPFRESAAQQMSMPMYSMEL